jgi:hypothetical protein
MRKPAGAVLITYDFDSDHGEAIAGVTLPQSEQYAISPARSGATLGARSRVLPQNLQYKVTPGAFSSVIVFSLLCKGSKVLQFLLSLRLARCHDLRVPHVLA